MGVMGDSMDDQFDAGGRAMERNSRQRNRADKSGCVVAAIAVGVGIVGAIGALKGWT
jgi:hypothetical protein